MLHGITKNILNFKDRLIVAKSNGKNHDKMINDLNFDVQEIRWDVLTLKYKVASHVESSQSQPVI